jgi:hypothetical protein
MLGGDVPSPAYTHKPRITSHVLALAGNGGIVAGRNDIRASQREETMTIAAVIRENFERSFGLYRDLVASLSASDLACKLPNSRSNTLGQQLWCVIGARESYSRAVRAGSWSGFSCSLAYDHTGDKEAVIAALQRSEAAVLDALAMIDGQDDAQHRLILDLLEHEAQHHGQVIRYLYGLLLTIPESWKSRYALED